MTPQQLRNSILQLAIEGKLVEQRPEEGTGEELYQLIQEEKDKLIKGGKIKKEKSVGRIEDNDIPFEIPDSWKWCCLGELFSHVAGKALNAKNTKGIKCKYLTTSNVYWDYFDLTSLKEMYYTEDEIEKYSVKYGDLLVLEGGDIGRSAIWNLEESYCIQNHIHRLRQYINISVKYFYYILMYFKYTGNILGKGIGIKGLSAKALHCIKVPLPPLNEQYRIVDKIERLFPFIKRYEIVWQKLNELNKKFPEELQKSILQEAIQGKLCEQKANDGSAQELIEKILLEKERLIETGQIKKQKALAPIQEDEIPFDIPSSWEWCYLGELFSHVAGKALNAKNTKGRKYKYLTTSNVYWDYFDLRKLKEMYYTDDEIEKYSVKYGDLLVLEGGDVGRSAIWNLEDSYCIQNHIHRLRPYGNICVKYFYYVMMYFKYSGNILGKGIGIKGLSSNALHCIKVPVPSLLEQFRIVKKVDKIITIINRYKKIFNCIGN